MKDTEIEIKLHVRDLALIEGRLQALGGELHQPHVLETNLRFDTPDRTLGRTYKVLRLRQDWDARLTYKGPGEMNKGARQRTELEFKVSDFEMAKAFLEALGFQETMRYEKRRAEYLLQGLTVTLDEMPFGNFVEIEGPDGAAIQGVCAALGLDWEARITDSYTGLFDKLRQTLGLSFTDLTFENFKGVDITPEDLQDLQVRPADL